MGVLAGRGKVRLSKVEHPKFEGQVTPNEDEYQKSVRLRFRYCLGVSQFTVSLRITCISAEEIDFEIGHFRNFWTSMTLTLTLHQVIQNTVVYYALTYIYTPIFTESEKLYVDGLTDIRMDTGVDLIH